MCVYKDDRLCKYCTLKLLLSLLFFLCISQCFRFDWFPLDIYLLTVIIRSEIELQCYINHFKYNIKMKPTYIVHDKIITFL